MTESGWTVYESPLGPLTLIAGPAGLRNILFPGRPPRLEEDARAPLPAVTDQLDRYFDGELVRVRPRARPPRRGAGADRLVPLAGDPLRADDQLRRARGTDRPQRLPRRRRALTRARLVGAAVGRTPTPIVVPCHRVIGADGSLTGYGGGLDRKRALLDLEQAGQRALL